MIIDISYLRITLLSKNDITKEFAAPYWIVRMHLLNFHHWSVAYASKNTILLELWSQNEKIFLSRESDVTSWFTPALISFTDCHKNISSCYAIFHQKPKTAVNSPGKLANCLSKQKWRQVAFSKEALWCCAWHQKYVQDSRQCQYYSFFPSFFLDTVCSTLHFFAHGDQTKQEVNKRLNDFSWQEGVDWNTCLYIWLCNITLVTVYE